jgi:branched-chain amino acid transport system substrate-binding protein
LDFTTFYGRYRIDPRTGRQLGHRMPVVQWQGGRKVVIWPS